MYYQFGVADVYTTNQVSGNAEAAITINGSLDISSELYMDDGSIRMTDKNGAYLIRDFDYGDTWFEVGLGGSVVLGKNLHLYGEVERSFGGDVTKNWSADVGVKYIF